MSGNEKSDHGFDNLPRITAGTSSEEHVPSDHFKATRQKFQQMVTVNTVPLEKGPASKAISEKKYRDTKHIMNPDVRPKENTTDSKRVASIPNSLSTDSLHKNGQSIRKQHEGTKDVCDDDVKPSISRVKPTRPRAIDTCTLSSEGAFVGDTIELESASLRVPSGIQKEQAIAQVSSDKQPNTNANEHHHFEQDGAHEIPYGGSDFVQVTGRHNKPMLCQPKLTLERDEKRCDLQGKGSVFQDLHIHVNFNIHSDDGENHEQNDTLIDKCEDDDSASQSSTRRMRQPAVPPRGRSPIHIHIHGDSMHICHQKQQRPKQTYEEVDIDNDSDGNTKKYYSLDVTPEHLNENDSSLEPAPEVPPRKPIQPSETPTIHESYQKPDDWRYDDGISTTKPQQTSLVPERKCGKGTPSWILPYKDYDLPDAKVLEIFNSDQSLKNQVMELYGNPWFYLYPDVKDAHRYLSLRNEDGCFALVAENIESSPFQPFTIIVVKDKRHIRVPILKASSSGSLLPSKLMVFGKSYDTIVEVLDDLICNSTKALGFKLREPCDSSSYQTNTW